MPLRIPTEVEWDKNLGPLRNEALGFFVHILAQVVRPTFYQDPSEHNFLHRKDMERYAGSRHRCKRLTAELLAAGAIRYVGGDHYAVTERLWSLQQTRFRKKIPDEVRSAVIAAADGSCVECGATEHLTLDHIHPWSLGGSDDPENLRCLCRSCNSRKGAKV